MVDKLGNHFLPKDEILIPYRFVCSGLWPVYSGFLWRVVRSGGPLTWTLVSLVGPWHPLSETSYLSHLTEDEGYPYQTNLLKHSTIPSLWGSSPSSFFKWTRQTTPLNKPTSGTGTLVSPLPLVKSRLVNRKHSETILGS